MAYKTRAQLMADIKTLRAILKEESEAHGVANEEIAYLGERNSELRRRIDSRDEIAERLRSRLSERDETVSIMRTMLDSRDSQITSQEFQILQLRGIQDRYSSNNRANIQTIADKIHVSERL